MQTSRNILFSNRSLFHNNIPGGKRRLHEHPEDTVRNAAKLRRDPVHSIRLPWTLDKLQYRASSERLLHVETPKQPVAQSLGAEISQLPENERRVETDTQRLFQSRIARRQGQPPTDQTIVQRQSFEGEHADFVHREHRSQSSPKGSSAEGSNCCGQCADIQSRGDEIQERELHQENHVGPENREFQ